MVISRSDVRDQWAERIERRIMAFFDLAFHIFLDLMHGHVSGTFDKGLHILVPGAEHQLAHSVQLGELRFIVGIVDRARTKSVTQRHRNVILSQNIADIVEVFI